MRHGLRIRMTRLLALTTLLAAAIGAVLAAPAATADSSPSKGMVTLQAPETIIPTAVVGRTYEITFTAMAVPLPSSGSPAPTGTVTLSAGTQPGSLTKLGTSSTFTKMPGFPGGYQLTIPVTFSSALGQVYLIATYSGDDSYYPSMMPQPLQPIDVVDEVSADATTTSANVVAGTVGSPARPAKIDLTVSTGGSHTPTGAVNAIKDGLVYASCRLADGACELDINGGVDGTHTFTLSYSGDQYNATSSATATVELGQGPTGSTPIVTLGSSPDPARVNVPVTLTAQISGASSGPPQGTATFSVGSTTLGSVPVNPDPNHAGDGLASLTHTFTTIGDRTVTVDFASSNQDYTDASGSATVSVDPPGAPITLRLTSSATSTLPSTSAQLTITLETSSGPLSTPPTVKVVDTSHPEVAPVVATPGTPDGGEVRYTATFASTTVGSHELQAVTGGNAAYAAATSNIVTVEVLPKAVGAYLTEVYQVLLNRSPGSAALQWWVNRVGAAGSLAGFTSFVAHSHEGVTNLVRFSYQAYLGREGDPTGVAYWTDRIVAGMPPGALQAAMLASSEAFRDAGSSAAWVTDLYKNPLVLDRDPDAGGLRYWVDRLDRGTARSAVARFFLGRLRSAQLVTGEAYTLAGEPSPPDASEQAAGVAYYRSHGDDLWALVGHLLLDGYAGPTP